VNLPLPGWVGQGTLHALVAPLSKEAQHSVLRPSHIKAPPKKKAAPQMSKAQLAEHIAESATGLTFLNPDEALEAGPGGSVDGGLGGRRKRKRPPQLNDAMHEVNQRAARRWGLTLSPSPAPRPPLCSLCSGPDDSVATMSSITPWMVAHAHPLSTRVFCCFRRSLRSRSSLISPSEFAPVSRSRNPHV
jgi:hypothetical protein